MQVHSNHKQAVSSWPGLALQHILTEILEVLFQKEGNCKDSNNNHCLRKSFIVLHLFSSPLANVTFQNVQYTTVQLRGFFNGFMSYSMLRNILLFQFWLLLLVFILEPVILLQLTTEKGTARSDSYCSCNSDTKIAISGSVLSHFPSQLIPAYEAIRKWFKCISGDRLVLYFW